MKSIALKSLFLLAIGLFISQASSAHPHYYREYYHDCHRGPRFIQSPRVIVYSPPVVYERGYWTFDRWGRRVYVRPYCR